MIKTLAAAVVPFMLFAQCSPQCAPTSEPAADHAVDTLRRPTCDQNPRPPRCNPTPTTTTTTQPATTTTRPIPPPSGAAFVEDFSVPGSFCGTRFDCDWGGETQAGSLFNDAANDWSGDHDAMCGHPANTHRTIHVEAGDNEAFQPANGLPKDVSQSFYQCAPGGDPAKAHAMTSVNTEGYVTAWFSPRQVFSDVSRVCWSQNLTWMGGGKWTIVNFLTPTEYQGQTDLGYTSPDFPNETGVSSFQGEARNGVKYFSGSLRSYTNGTFNGGPDIGVGSQDNPITDKAARYQICVVDNDDGTLTLTLGGPNGPATSTVAGSIPDGQIRVEFADDNYNNDKHFSYPERPIERDSTGLYTVHWDDIIVE
jgi:hypothetical protein